VTRPRTASRWPPVRARPFPATWCARTRAWASTRARARAPTRSRRTRFQGNGTGGAETAGIAIGGASTTLDRNELSANTGAGALVASGATTITITRNSIYGNGPATGQVGIDLLAAADDGARGTAPFRTRNDNGDVDAGGNGLLNFPVITTAAVAGGNLTISGYARPGSTIELFTSDLDPSGFGEGRTWLATFVEGSGADLDAATGAYSGVINGVDQGSDNTNRFRFTIPTPSGVGVGSFVTATATLAGATSEFSGRDGIGGGVAVSGYAYADANHDAGRDAGENGTNRTLYVKLVTEPFTASADQVATVDPVTGLYLFPTVSAGPYSFILDDNATPTDLVPTMPPGWIATQAAPGIRPGTLVASADIPNLDFGLYNGSRVDGMVVRDDGAGAGAANDGARNGGEAGVGNVFVDLAAAGCPSGVCDSTRTDGAGAFRLFVPAVASGAASLRETNPPSWISTGGRAGTTAGTYTRATDVLTFTPSAGTLYSGVELGDVPANTFAAGARRTWARARPRLYAHRFVAGTAGVLAFGSSQVATPAIPGWTIDLVRDTNCNGVIDAGELALSGPLAVTAGEAVCLAMRHASPAGAAAGASAQATLSASFTYTNAAPALAGTVALVDLTTVLGGGGGLSLAKAVDFATARPGDVLTYTVTYANLGTTPLSSIVIQDATPPYTVFISGSCGTLDRASADAW
jgi:uncharacterized repeat protein (TIGR01451 family)